MLQLKSQYHTASTVYVPSHITVLDLPSEILDLIVSALYLDDTKRLSTILPLSRVSRQFRRSTLPFLFDSASSVIREDLADVAHRSFHQLKLAAHLHSYVKQLWVRAPLKNATQDLEERVVEDGEAERRRLSDIEDVVTILQSLRSLQVLRYVIKDLLCSSSEVVTPCLAYI